MAIIEVTPEGKGCVIKVTEADGTWMTNTLTRKGANILIGKIMRAVGAELAVIDKDTVIVT